MKNVFDGLISSLNMTEKRISEPQYMSVETSQPEMQREKKRKTRKPEHNIQELWDNIKRGTRHIIRVPEGAESEKKQKNM